jgi:hypothetical protein
MMKVAEQGFPDAWGTLAAGIGRQGGCTCLPAGNTTLAAVYLMPYLFIKS